MRQLEQATDAAGLEALAFNLFNTGKLAKLESWVRSGHAGQDGPCAWGSSTAWQRP